MEEYTPTQVRNALLLWVCFFVILVLINGTIPFILGADLLSWTSSLTKHVLISGVLYAGLFFLGSLALAKAWEQVKQPQFLGPVIIGAAGITLSAFVQEIAVIAVIVYAYLALRYRLPELGFKSRGLRGDVVAVVLFGAFSFLAVLMRIGLSTFTPEDATMAMVYRLFFNPASTAENVFYFGFLTERMSQCTGKWGTPFLIAGMYTVHEMSNPEYWYEGIGFVLIFIEILFAAIVYLWRRNIVVNWLGDGFSRFVLTLFA